MRLKKILFEMWIRPGSSFQIDKRLGIARLRVQVCDAERDLLILCLRDLRKLGQPLPETLFEQVDVLGIKRQNALTV